MVEEPRFEHSLLAILRARGFTRNYRGQNLVDRLWSFVERRGPDDHWPWTGAVLKHRGYGQFWALGHNFLAHRAIKEVLEDKPLPDQVILRNRCGRPDCCNPDHWTSGLVDMSGESSPAAQLTNEQAREIYLRVNGIGRPKEKTTRLAVEFGTNASTVSRIGSGERYAEATRDLREGTNDRDSNF